MPNPVNLLERSIPGYNNVFLTAVYYSPNDIMIRIGKGITKDDPGSPAFSDQIVAYDGETFKWHGRMQPDTRYPDARKLSSYVMDIVSMYRLVGPPLSEVEGDTFWKSFVDDFLELSVIGGVVLS